MCLQPFFPYLPLVSTTTSSRKPERGDGAISTLDKLIGALNVAKDTCGILPAQIVFGSASDLLGVIRETMANDQDYVELGKACGNVCKALDVRLKGWELVELNPPVLGAIRDLTTTVAKIQEGVAKRGERTGIFRFIIFWKRDEGEVNAGWRQDLARFLHIFDTQIPLRLTVSHLEPYLLSREEMIAWGYVVDVPKGPGGNKRSEKGGTMKCDRCRRPKRAPPTGKAKECVYHWGRPTKKVGGETVGEYTCCSAPSTRSSRGCVRGPHVFYEHEPASLHKRHAFTHTRPPVASRPSGTLEVAALDCEMVYTTGGMSVARVSVVDRDGKEVFDKYVKMDRGVQVVDFNTRFSGITPEVYSACARQRLAEIRRSLEELIDSETILIGHALENDLKALRMIHLRNVDTAFIFRRPAGPKQRWALRDLAKEHLGRHIQTGGADVGHSSVEDSVASLDLVKWHVINGERAGSMGTQNPRR